MKNPYLRIDLLGGIAVAITLCSYSSLAARNPRNVFKKNQHLELPINL